jgi:DNA invertase Pin-like site-specific DNA recombinase
MAARSGFKRDEVEIFIDLGRSGGSGKERLRAEYQRLLAEIESGTVTHLYALSVTRLGRSVIELKRVAELCKEKGVRLEFQKEGLQDPTTPTGQLFFTLLAAFAEFERLLAVERAKDNHATRKARGEPAPGPKNYEDTDGNHAADLKRFFEETRSINATAKAMNEAGFKSWRGKNWTPTSIRNVLTRTVPDLLPVRPQRGVKPSGSFITFRLVHCSCGRTMTAYTGKAPSRHIYLRCHSADLIPGHPRPFRAREDAVLDFLKAEVAHIDLHADEVAATEEQQQRLGVLQARRDRWIEMYGAGDIDRDTYRARIGEVNDRIADVSSDLRLRAIPDKAAILADWDTLAREAPATLSQTLRALFRWVELDAEMKPVRAEWTEPRWDARRPQVAAA